LDPLGITRQVAADKLKSYLKKEALSKLGVGASDFIEPEVVTASCPIQKNFTDCGVYCLHYILNFFQKTDIMIATVHVSVYV
jgi:Ulp1 family protease